MSNHAAPSRSHGLVVPVWLTFCAVAVSALRVGTLLGLAPRLLSQHSGSGPFLVLALHVLGAVATVAAVLLHSRTGLLIAVLYTGYSTVVLALGAPTPQLQVMTWIVGGLALALVLACAVCAGSAQRRSTGSLAVIATAGLVAGVVLLLLLR